MRYAYELLPHVEALRAKRWEFSEMEDSLFWELYERSSPYSLLLIT